MASELVKPARVKESPVQLECEVQQVIELGQNGGAGNLVICKVLKMHIDESILNENGQIDQTKIDLVARMGGDWYCRAHGDAMFELVKPLTNCGIGVDALPEHIRLSHILSGNDLGQLGNIETIPDNDFIQGVKAEFAGNDPFHTAKSLLAEGKSKEALALLW
jgi:hypothetical protein